MALKAHSFVGLSKPVYLPDDIKVEISIVPFSVGNVRSNQKRAPSQVTTFTQHETANFNNGANADMHKRWLHSGAGGSYVGFNFAVDDKTIIQLTPLDEITWAAGTPGGNLTSDHSELCVNGDGNHVKARRNAAALAAGVLKARGLPVEKLIQHNVWYGKDCPYLLRRNGLWDKTFVPMVREFYSGASDAIPTPRPEPAKPSGKRTFALRFDTYVRSSPGFWNTDKNEQNVIKLLKAGTKGEVINGPKTVDGIEFYDIKVDGFGTGWIQDQVLHTLEIKEG